MTCGHRIRRMCTVRLNSLEAIVRACMAALICVAASTPGVEAGSMSESVSLLRIGRIDRSADELNVLSVVPDEFVRAVRDLPDPLTPETWPQIQAGVYDAWAGSREHVYRIVVPTPEQSGTYRLRIGILASHPEFPPNLIVRLADRTIGEYQTRAGRQMLAVDNTIQDIEPELAEFHLPGALFDEDTTVLEVRLDVPSSWVFYDGIEFDWLERTFEPSMAQVTFRADTLVHRTSSGPMQRPLISFALSGIKAPVEAAIRNATGEVVSTEVYPADVGEMLFGMYEMRPNIPASRERRSFTLELRGQRTEIKRSFDVPGYREVELYVVPEAHFDNGYTHPQEETVAIHMESLQRALAYSERYTDFSWTNESAYILQRWWEQASPDDRERLLTLVREGKVGLDAGWANIMSGLCTTEELHRWLLWAGTFAAEHDLDLRTVSLTDVPSHVASMPTILAGSGVEFLTIGANPDRSEFWRFGAERAHNPFWWEGPDGQRVLTLAHRHYAHATSTGLTISLETAEREIPRWLDRFYGPDAPGGGYAYDVLHLHGAYWDNRLLDERLPDVVRAWNAKYAWPRIRLATNSEFFDRLREEASRKAEVHRGDQGAYWEDGAASSARETAMTRRAARMLNVAETLLTGLHARGELNELPISELRRAWELVLLYDEHTWGAAWSVSDPDDARTFNQFSTKSQYAKDAEQMAVLLMRLAAAKLPEAAAPIRQPGSLSGGRELPANVIASAHVRVTVDPGTGLIGSIRRLADDAEFVEPDTAERMEDGFGQFLYFTKERHDPPDNVNDRQFDMELTRPRFVGLERADGCLISVFEHAVLGRIEMVVAPAHDAARVDLEYRIRGKQKNRELESVYVAFPFDLDAPTIDYEIGGAVVRAGRDWMPHACLDWFSIQDFVHLHDDQHERSVVWSSPDAPLVCLQAVTTHMGLDELPITNGRVYSYLMNNFWQTNFQAEQGGEFVFRYSIALPERTGNAQARRHVSQFTPEVLAAVDAMVRVDAPNVRMVSFKRAEDGDGYIVRIQEMDGLHGDVDIEIGALRDRGIRTAELVTGVEHPHDADVGQKGLSGRDSVIRSHLHPYEIQTIRVRPGGGGQVGEAAAGLETL
jgi:alpha-mannosidase